MYWYSLIRLFSKSCMIQRIDFQKYNIQFQPTSQQFIIFPSCPKMDFYISYSFFITFFAKCMICTFFALVTVFFKILCQIQESEILIMIYTYLFFQICTKQIKDNPLVPKKYIIYRKINVRNLKFSLKRPKIHFLIFLKYGSEASH